MQLDEGVLRTPKYLLSRQTGHDRFIQNVNSQ